VLYLYKFFVRVLHRSLFSIIHFHY